MQSNIQCYKNSNITNLSKESNKWFEKIKKVNSHHEKHIFKQFIGVDLINQRQYKESTQSFDLALQNNSNDVDLLINKGKISFKLMRHNTRKYGIVKRINRMLQNTLQINPINEDSLYWKDAALEKIGYYYEAFQCFEKVLEMNQKHEDSLFRKGSTLSMMGLYERSIELFDNVLEINPKHKDSLYWRGASLINIGLYDESMLWYDEVLSFNPNHEDSLYQKGVG